MLEILKFEDLGIRLNNKYVSRFILSDGRICEFEAPTGISPGLRLAGDVIQLKQAGVSDEALQKFKLPLLNEISIL